MQQILVIAKQTFREAIRNKILFIFIFLSLVAIGCTFFMPVVGGGGEKLKVVESMCLRSITFFGMLAAILLSASSIPSDIEYKLLWTVITKPISRASFILGKIMGFIYIIGLLLLVMGSASYALIRFTAFMQETREGKLIARVECNVSSLQVTGDSAKKSGDYHWIEGGGKGASEWSFKGLHYKSLPDKFEIEMNMFMQTSKKYARRIPVNIKMVNSDTGEVQTETIEIAHNRHTVLEVDGNILEGAEELTVIMTPKNSGDFIGMRTDSLKIYLERKSFEYNFLKGLTIISFQFILMITIATLGSTFLSLPVNILFCLFVFLCGNITDFLRDLSIVINTFDTHEHDHEHGISTAIKSSDLFVYILNYVLKKPLLLLSYILPNFRNFNVVHYFIDSVNIPLKNILTSGGYAMLYVLFCLPVSFIIFRRREIA